MDDKLKPIHGAWIPAIHAGMTFLEGMMMKSDKVELGKMNKGCDEAEEQIPGLF